MLRMHRGPLREAAGEGDGGGDKPQPVTVEDVGRMVNAAITGKLKSLNLDARFSELSTSLDAKLGEISAALAARPEPEPDGGKGKSKDIDPEVKKQLEGMAKQLEQERTLRETAQKERAEIEQRRNFDTARAMLANGLKDAAHPDMHDLWVDQLVFKNRLKLAEDGTPMLEVEHAPIKGMPKQREFLPLEEAVPHLLASDEAKRFKGVSQPDDKGNRAPRAAGSHASLKSDDPIERANARLRDMGLGSLDEALIG